ncbi:twin-arginine translocase TatA/TatE family subunit [Coraliomargarita sp. SDUM461004]|uniref:Sec-independent protein translocase protein TatA n=1 Tax=Thalassobacterium sedimentorum TaxID=3041258 RepID=A0ABU1AFL5_9BACT|nr:twin-arginine translocase TatA/TatE family subunit [Coraliomargarita sp. SDUM461004]MDQ8193560.1 twin-arginine translocase TatA/TatE family subunit [Coraliomargarita sp. SDUM461004]
MNPFAFIQNINGPEILLIFLIVLLLFGAKRLPELFKSFGKSIREFKKATSEIEEDIRTAMDEEPSKPEVKAAPRQVESASAGEEADKTEKVEKA